ncbi:MAG: hydrogenase maturation nickel metallochaperone HypA, partial [Thermovirgaceae bacterium]
MHELSMVESLIEELLKLQEQHGWCRINAVYLRVGEMRQVIPEIMHFAFDITIRETALEGSQLFLEEVPLKKKCKACGHVWTEGDEALFLCENCGSADVELLEGMELEIESLEVEETDAEEDQ